MLDRSTLAQTARDAAGGGGVLVTLAATDPGGRRWRATVAGRSGRRVVVLDLALGTAEVRAGRGRGIRRRPSPGCTMRACPPRTRRPA